MVRADEYSDGLNPAQWEALRYFHSCNRFSRRPGALVAYLGSTKGTVSQTMAALERKGLIRKTFWSGDKRRVQVDLTDAGSALMMRDPLRALDRTPAAAGGAPVVALSQILRDLQRTRGTRSFGVCSTCRFFGRGPRGEGHCGLLDVALTEEDSGRICAEHEAA
jgi:hypothetical protein